MKKKQAIKKSKVPALVWANVNIKDPNNPYIYLSSIRKSKASCKAAVTCDGRYPCNPNVERIMRVSLLLV